MRQWKLRDRHNEQKGAQRSEREKKTHRKRMYSFLVLFFKGKPLFDAAETMLKYSVQFASKYFVWHLYVHLLKKKKTEQHKDTRAQPETCFLAGSLLAYVL